VFGEHERNQLNLLNEQKEALVTETAARVLRRLLGWIAFGFTLLGALAGIGLYQIYSGLRTLVSDRIAAQFDEPRIKNIRVDPTIPWKPEVNPKELGAKEFQNIYRNLAPFYRPAVLSALWESERTTKKEKLDFLAAVIRGDDTLRAVERACRLMDQEAKLNKNVLGATEYVEWWERNREHY
jgi:hypothetical protein